MWGTGDWEAVAGVEDTFAASRAAKQHMHKCCSPLAGVAVLPVLWCSCCTPSMSTSLAADACAAMFAGVCRHNSVSSSSRSGAMHYVSSAAGVAQSSTQRRRGARLLCTRGPQMQRVRALLPHQQQPQQPCTRRGLPRSSSSRRL